MDLINFGGAYLKSNSSCCLVTSVTSGGTSSLTSTSNGKLIIIGTDTTHNVILPNATTLVAAGHKFEILNDSAATVTVKDSAGSTIFSLKPGLRLCAVCTDKSTSVGSWSLDITSTRPHRIFTNYNTSLSMYTTNAVIETADLYEKLIGLSNDNTLTMPNASQMYSDLTTILGSAPPIGFTFTPIIMQLNGKSTFTDGVGCTWYGSRITPLANSTSSSLSVNLRICINSPTAYTTYNLRDTDYEEQIFTSATDIVAAPTITFRISRRNSNVAITIPDVGPIYIPASTTTYITCTTALPLNYRPSLGQSLGVLISIGSTWATGVVQISTAGVISFRKTSGNWILNEAISIYTCAVSYTK